MEECIQEPVYVWFVKEVDANIEEEGGEVRVLRGCLGFLSIIAFKIVFFVMGRPWMFVISYFQVEDHVNMIGKNHPW